MQTCQNVRGAYNEAAIYQDGERIPKAMKKTILLILTAVALVLTVVSSLLCFIQNAELTSMGVKMDENLAALDYGEKLLRNPNVLSYVDIFFDSEKITPYIKNFDAEESVTFPMRLGMVAWFSIASLIGSIVFPVGGIGPSFDTPSPIINLNVPSEF